MRFLLLHELLLTKQKILQKKECWHSLVSVVRKEEYEASCRILQEAGLDYRVWMRTDAPAVQRLRYILEDPIRYRIQYDFFVHRCDFKNARRALKAGTKLGCWNDFSTTL